MKFHLDFPRFTQLSRLFVVVSLLSAVLLSGCSMRRMAKGVSAPEVVAELDVTPGNVAVSRTGRMFASVHGMRRAGVQLIEIVDHTKWKPFPNAAWNKAPGSGRQVLNSPLGVVVDHRDWLWVIDSGNFLAKPLSPKVVAFDIASGKVKFRYDFPEGVAPRGSFLQDLVVSPDGEFVYIADAGGRSRPGIVVVNTKKGRAYRYDSMRKFEAEDVDVKVRGKVLTLVGKDGLRVPARIGLDPITLSKDGETVFFGSMNGTSWYRVPAKLLRERASRVAVNKAIERVGPKPVSDGAATDDEGNHYFASVNDDSIVRLRSDGALETVIMDPILEWPDSVRFGPDGALYVAVNQLNRTAALDAAGDGGVAPYRVVKITLDSTKKIAKR